MSHGEDKISDSRFIVRYLLNTYSDLNKHEPSEAESKARATFIQRLCEQHMYFTSLYYGVVPEEV